VILDVAHEGFDGGQSGVPGNGSVLALGLDVLQEGQHHGGINLFQLQLRRGRLQTSGGILKQQAKGVRIRIAGMLAGTTINREALA
jgi:hypothetical protein